MKIEKTLSTDTLSYKLNLINTTRALFWLTLFAIAFSTLYSVQYRISCQDKAPGVANRCQLTSSFYGLFHVSTPISQIQSVTVIKSRWSYFHRMPDAYALYNIDLVTDKGPINIAYMPESNLEELISVAKRLNDYITNSSSTTFDIHSLSSLWDYVTCAFFLLMGLLI